MDRIEQLCNENIRRSIPMLPHWYNIQDPKMEAVSIWLRGTVLQVSGWSQSRGVVKVTS